MSNRGTETCPVCRCGMFPGDVVCLRCQGRVRTAMPNLLRDYINRDITAPGAVELADEMRRQITFCAVQQLPAFGRKPKGAKP